jgi:putative transposase
MRSGAKELLRSTIPTKCSQFTGEAFTGTLKAHGISMDGKGRALNNRMIERLWRTVKYHDIYVKAYETTDPAHNQNS